MSEATTAAAVELDVWEERPRKLSRPGHLRYQKKRQSVDKRNFHLGVWNGVLYALGVSFMSHSTVIPSFLSKLTDSNALIGVISQLETIGWYFPQLFVSSFVIHKARKIPLYRLSAVIRSTMYLVIAGVTLWLEPSGMLLICFIASYGLFCMGAGVGGVVFLELLAKAIPANRRGRFLGIRNSIGAVLAATLGASTITVILTLERFPINYGYVFLIGAVITALGLSMMAVMREPRATNLPKARNISAQLRAGFAFLKKDKRFRKYVKARMTLATWTAGVPFLILYGTRKLGFTTSEIGIFIAIECAGLVLANMIWERVALRYSTTRVIRLSCILAMTVPLLVLAYEVFPIPRLFFPITLALAAGVDCGTTIGGIGYLIEIAPHSERATYIGLFNTLLALPILLTGIAGLLLDIAGFAVLYGVILILAIASLRLSLRLEHAPVPIPSEAF